MDLTGTTGIAEEGYSDTFLGMLNRGGTMSMVDAVLLIIVATIYGTILIEIFERRQSNPCHIPSGKY